MRYAIFVAFSLIGLFNQREAGLLGLPGLTSLTKVLYINPATGDCVTAFVPSNISSSDLVNVISNLAKQIDSAGNFKLSPQAGNANYNGTSVIPGQPNLSCVDIQSFIRLNGGLPVDLSILINLLGSVLGSVPTILTQIGPTLGVLGNVGSLVVVPGGLTSALPGK